MYDKAYERRRRVMEYKRDFYQYFNGTKKFVKTANISINRSTRKLLSNIALLLAGSALLVSFVAMLCFWYFFISTKNITGKARLDVTRKPMLDGISFSWPHLNSIRTQTTPVIQKLAVEGLIERYFPGRQEEFLVTVLSDLGPVDRDTFILSTDASNRLNITGSSGVAAAMGLYYYLKEYGHCHISWFDWQLNLSQPLPTIDGVVEVTTNDRFHYNANVCTFGYSYVWWNWTRWEHEIDWMVLNGINIPLAFVGQEAIYQKVFLNMGVKQSELDEWFTGPAFLPWFRMGNMVKWGGPLSQNFIDTQAELQKLILKRMRDFGMTPVLPGFAGHVPPAIQKLFPEADITALAAWSNFNCSLSCTLYLNPLDSLYAKIATMFLDQLTKAFGTDHVYNVDPWNEMTPNNSSVSFLRDASNTILKSLTTVDPQAVWMLQGWMFTYDKSFWSQERAKAFLTGVPKGRILVLDLAAEYEPVYSRLNSFYGQPFIWCMLNNYGGRLGLFGHINSINENVFVARHNASSMVGTGLSMEGRGTNYVLYELTNEMHYRTSSVILSDWLQDYSDRRYGFTSNRTGLAWIHMAASALGSYNIGQQILIQRPNLQIQADACPDFNIDDIKIALQAVMEVVLDSPRTARSSPLFLHDLVTIWREVFVIMLCDLYPQVLQEYKYENITALKILADEWLNILDDLELLLASNDDFLLGRWIAAAEQKAGTSADQLLFRQNALNQISLWGPHGEIRDYAGKQWSGCVKDYYKPRWTLFFEMLIDAVQKSTDFDIGKFTKHVFETVEKPFTKSMKYYKTEAEGDTVNLSLYLWNKYIVK